MNDDPIVSEKRKQVSYEIYERSLDHIEHLRVIFESGTTVVFIR